MTALERHNQERASDGLIAMGIREMKEEAEQAAQNSFGSTATKAVIRYRSVQKYIFVEARSQRQMLRRRVARMKAKIEKDPSGPDAQRARRAESFHWDIEAIEQEINALKFDSSAPPSVYIQPFLQVMVEYYIAAQQARDAEEDSAIGSDMGDDQSDIEGGSDSEEGELDLIEEEGYTDDEDEDSEVGEMY